MSFTLRIGSQFSRYRPRVLKVPAVTELLYDLVFGPTLPLSLALGIKENLSHQSSPPLGPFHKSQPADNFEIPLRDSSCRREPRTPDYRLLCHKKQGSIKAEATPRPGLSHDAAVFFFTLSPAYRQMIEYAHAHSQA